MAYNAMIFTGMSKPRGKVNNYYDPDENRRDYNIGGYFTGITVFFYSFVYKLIVFSLLSSYYMHCLS